jgi:hypothetical protein
VGIRLLCVATVLSAALIAVAGRPLRAATVAESPVTCAGCHAKEAGQFARSVHSKADFDCLKCHGGLKEYRLPSEGLAAYLRPATQSAPTTASRPAFDHGKQFRGKASRAQVPERCGDCHAKVEVMNPYGLRTDQLARYETSVHGKTLRRFNDDRVAVCIDCHGTHDVLGPKDPNSPVNPLRVPDTCGRCHGDGKLMANYNLSGFVPGDYKASVHGQGLLERGDLAMPMCATCHDNHAASPPGFRDVGHVCGRCHQQTESYFKESIHAKFPDFPPCIGCHSLDPGKRPHQIPPVTQGPDELVKLYRPVWERLAEGRTTPQAIHEQLAKVMLKADEQFPVRLRLVCRRCHEVEFQVGHRIFFKKLDEQAPAYGRTLDQMIQEAQVRYVETSSRLGEVRRRGLMVQDEVFGLEQAKTQLTVLVAIQHTLDTKKVSEAAKNVSDICGQVASSLDEKEAALRWRRWGLLPLWVFLAAFIAALWVKYEQLRKAYVAPLKAHGEGGS